MPKWRSVKCSTLAASKQKHAAGSIAGRFCKFQKQFPSGWASDEVLKNTAARAKPVLFVSFGVPPAIWTLAIPNRTHRWNIVARSEQSRPKPLVSISPNSYRKCIQRINKLTLERSHHTSAPGHSDAGPVALFGFEEKSKPVPKTTSQFVTTQFLKCC